ncbi:unnamed protein product [Bursaphelenchus xylophilus]|uniref:(pine wood nematode) hypothetical protein n=1 Tax=Bursaphelenchus xylophilus TaxID=6326 RepID=A0A1I7RZ29_BURXY|nr:unnamed protein product [Bursaphelenchus xylophilus]CAG9106917.1 unnamed protein product [Bursaphelenchus xylophilus]
MGRLGVVILITLLYVCSTANRTDLRPAGGHIIYAYNITCLGKPVQGTMNYYTYETTVDTFNVTGYHNKYFLKPDAPSTIFLELKYKCKGKCFSYKDRITFDVNIAENGLRDLELANLNHSSIPCDFGV